jgi:aryl-alcohol dehydrogenase-like predicted oxidoreductase
MKLRTLGSTDLNVSPVGLGLAALGRPGYINLGHGQDLGGSTSPAQMESHAHMMLDAAWSMGIRYFDAARSYGQAEAFLASWLSARQIPVDQVVVGSKWGYTYTANWQIQTPVHEVKEHTLANLQKQWGESRVILGDYLKLYQVHSATEESGVLDNQPVLDELLRLKKQEGIAIGLTVSGPDQEKTLRHALKIRPGGHLLFDTAQVTYNLLEQSTGSLLRTAREMGLGIIVKEALANGRLTPRNDDPTFAEEQERLASLAEETGSTVDAVALAALLNEPWIDVVLSGATTPQQLQANMGAVSVDWSGDLRRQIQGFEEAPEQYWETRSQLAWN